jgi:hypothetical protein
MQQLGTNREPEDGAPRAVARRPRLAGEGRYRCLWCERWACAQALAICPLCAAWYRQRVAEMPLEREVEGKGQFRRTNG